MSLIFSTPPEPAALTTMSPNSSGSTRRPVAVTVYTIDWPGGAGSVPILPAAYCAFCARRAAATSEGVTPRRAIFSGLSQMRIE